MEEIMLSPTDTLCADYSEEKRNTTISASSTLERDKDGSEYSRAGCHIKTTALSNLLEADIKTCPNLESNRSMDGSNTFHHALKALDENTNERINDLISQLLTPEDIKIARKSVNLRIIPKRIDSLEKRNSPISAGPARSKSGWFPKPFRSTMSASATARSETDLVFEEPEPITPASSKNGYNFEDMESDIMNFLNDLQGNHSSQ
jgi:hypothetical protein